MEGKDLAAVLQKHGAAVGDSRRLAGLFRDYFPKERRKVWLLERALAQKYAYENEMRFRAV